MEATPEEVARAVVRVEGTQLVEMEAQHARVGAEKLPPGSTRAGSRPAGSAQTLPPEIEIRDRDR